MLIYASLKPEELYTLLSHERPITNTHFTVGCLDTENKTVSFVQAGETGLITVRLDIFKSSGDGIKPDFGKFRIIDYGLTVAFGEYEAASTAILDDWALGNCLSL